MGVACTALTAELAAVFHITTHLKEGGAGNYLNGRAAGAVISETRPYLKMTNGINTDL